MADWWFAGHEGVVERTGRWEGVREGGRVRGRGEGAEGTEGAVRFSTGPTAGLQTHYS